MNIHRVYDCIKKSTLNYDFNNEYQNYDENTSIHIAHILGIRRNGASHFLNELFQNDQLIKINTRPVYFFSKEVIEESFHVSMNQTQFSSLKEFLDNLRNLKNPSYDPFSKMIGYNSTISYEIEQCKVAVNYPSDGLPVLIHGATGVGKSLMAQLMHEYAAEKKVIGENAPFIVVNCSEFANNPELLTANLFGYVKGAFTGADESKSGFIEEANGGYLFLDEIHRLPPEGQEKLFLFMDKGIFRRLGETQAWRKSKVRLIFATTEKPREILLSTFLRRIPIVINIPSLEERTLSEKISLISNFFKEEAMNIKKELVLGRQTMNILINHRFEGNIGELKNIIKYTCANAYYKSIGAVSKSDSANDLLVNVSHLPDEFIKKSDTNIEKLLMDETSFDDIRINASSCGENAPSILIEDTILEELFLDVMGVYDNYSKNILDQGELISDVNKILDMYFDRIITKISADYSGYNIRLNYIKKVTDGIVEFVKNNYGVKLYSNTSSTLANYIYFRSKNRYKEHKHLSKKINEFLILIKNLYPKEYELTEKITGLVNSNLGIEQCIEDIIVTTLYIKGIYKNLNTNRIRAVIITHGHSTASSIANVANRLLGQYVFESMDMPFDTSVEQIIGQLVDYTNSTDNGKGIIIMVDMGSLEDIHVSLEGIARGTIGIINNITTYLALDTGAKILKGMDVEDIVIQVAENCQPKYKIVKNENIRKKAILTTCITGIGTANKIRELLIESISEYTEELEVIPYDFISLKNNALNDNVFKNYDVIGIIGTANSKIEDIPFIALEDIMMGQNWDSVVNVFRKIISEEEIVKLNNKIIKLFSLQSVINYLTILNPNRLMNHIETVTKSMEAELRLKFSNSVRVSLFVHISCMIERLVKNNFIDSYKDIDSFKQSHNIFINIVKKSFSVMENIYNVQIPVSEIGYIYDIVRMKTENLSF